MRSVSFFVPMRPVGKQRPRFGRGHTYTPSATVAAERVVASRARRAILKPFPGPVHVGIIAMFRRPAKPAHDWPSGPDLDNIVKLVLDAMNGIAYKDDSCVVNISADKVFADDEGIDVAVAGEDTE